MTSPHAKGFMTEVGPRSPHTALSRSVVNEAGPSPEHDNLTSFPLITDEEAEEIKELMRIDRAGVYGG